MHEMHEDKEKDSCRVKHKMLFTSVCTLCMYLVVCLYGYVFKHNTAVCQHHELLL